jgi:hypothetical protein
LGNFTFTPWVITCACLTGRAWPRAAPLLIMVTMSRGPPLLTAVRVFCQSVTLSSVCWGLTRSSQGVGVDLGTCYGTWRWGKKPGLACMQRHAFINFAQESMRI